MAFFISCCTSNKQNKAQHIGKKSIVQINDSISIVSYFDSTSNERTEIYINNKDKTNTSEKTYWLNGRLKKECGFLYGLKNGKSVEWDSTGNLSVVEHYDKGVINGERTMYKSNGIIWLHGIYKNGKMVSNLNKEYELKDKERELYEGFKEAGMDSISASNAVNKILEHYQKEAKEH